MHHPSRQHDRPAPRCRRRPAPFVLAVLLAAGPAALSLAQHRGQAPSSGQQVRSSTTTSGNVGRYRAFGRHRGGTQAPPQRQPFLQPSLSGPRPEGFGRHVTGIGVHHLHPGIHHPPHHLPVVFAGTFDGGLLRTIPPPQQPPVIVVQLPPPPPVVVQLPPQPQPASAAPPVASPPVTPPPAAVSGEPGQVRFAVTPPEAEVFLDQRRLGTGAELVRGEPARVAAGVHVLRVTLDGFPDERLIFGVEPSAQVVVEIDLAETRSSLRTRLTAYSPKG